MATARDIYERNLTDCRALLDLIDASLAQRDREVRDGTVTHAHAGDLARIRAALVAAMQAIDPPDRQATDIVDIARDSWRATRGE